MQPVSAAWPDVESWATTYVSSALASRGVTGVLVDRTRDVDDTLPCVVIRRDGGSVRGIFDDARVSVRVWHSTEQGASALALLVRSLLLAAPRSSPVVARVESLSGPVSVTGRSPERFMSLEVTTRGIDL
jgi:hypothetical protein